MTSPKTFALAIPGFNHIFRLKLGMPGKKGTVIMKEINGVADHFFAQLKNALPPGIGLAEELSDLLNISMDESPFPCESGCQPSLLSSNR